MIVCVVALIVLAIMSIFSAKYRTYTKEAFRCVGRRVMLKPCDTSFDQRVKSKITGKLMKWPRMAKFTYRHFEGMAWAFMIVMTASFLLTVNTAYNLATYGTCDPSSSSCVFNPSYTPSNCTGTPEETANISQMIQCPKEYADCIKNIDPAQFQQETGKDLTAFLKENGIA
jgi:hypothetical protein